MVKSIKNTKKEKNGLLTTFISYQSISIPVIPSKGNKRDILAMTRLDTKMILKKITDRKLKPSGSTVVKGVILWVVNYISTHGTLRFIYIWFLNIINLVFNKHFNGQII